MKTLDSRYSDKTAHLEGHSVADIASLDTSEEGQPRGFKVVVRKRILPVFTEGAHPVSIAGPDFLNIGRRQLTDPHCYVGASESMTEKTHVPTFTRKRQDC